MSLLSPIETPWSKEDSDLSGSEAEDSASRDAATANCRNRLFCSAASGGRGVPEGTGQAIVEGRGEKEGLELRDVAPDLLEIRSSNVEVRL